MQLLEVLNDKSLQKQMGTNARKLVEEKYTWHQVAEMTEEVYKGASMKICLISNLYHPFILGGAEIVVEKVADELLREDMKL